MSVTLGLIIFILIALTFDFMNGFHDSANVVATAIASNAIPPRTALAISALSNLIGPFLFGVAVATTIGSEVVNSEAVTIPVAMAALISAIAWNAITWLLGIPSSSSHALIGGFVGAAIAGYGVGAIHMEGLILVLVGLFISPFIGLIFGWLIYHFTLLIAQYATRRVNIFFRRAQWVTVITLGLSHGTNDAQKTMGIMAMGLVAFGVIPTFYVPAWVIAASALAMAIGTALGGWRLIRTMGAGFYRVRPIHAVTSQVASTVVILGAALVGAPVSTTQVISSSIVGVGTAHRFRMVRWRLVNNIATAWILTIPITGVLGGLTYWLLIRLYV
jgi:PiT family inorganic phosphate transporter